MDKANAKLVNMLAVALLVVMSGGTAIADDTEFFRADPSINGGSANRPNILFIMDTSGSMRSEVLTQSNWDPNLTFAGCYRSDAVYWSYTNQAPACGSNKWFYKTRNYCQASQGPLTNLGEWSGMALGHRQGSWWKPSRWLGLSTSHSRPVECQDDAGLHGQTSGTFWAADGSAGPWSGNSNAEPAWTTNYHLFDGNRLNWLQGNGTVTSTRIQVVKDVTNQLLDNLDGVNVGLMRFNNDDGGPVIHALEDIATARAGMKASVNSLTANGWTPLSETMYEAGQYYAGRSVDYGSGHQYSSVAASRVGNTLSSGTYQSPVDFACQKNYIVLLTDGQPTQDTGAESKIENLPGFKTTVGPQCELLPGDTSDNGKCLDEMADYLHNYDIASQHSDTQSVTTYTIGFAEELPFLEETARRGGGEYYKADDTTTLANALTKIVVSILDDASTFTAPSVPVNAFNRTQNLDDIFVSVFNPSSTVHWPGNLKKYKLKNGRFIDVNDALAVDPGTGFFKETAQSFWSAAPDGDRPPAGGAALKLPGYGDLERKLYTNIAGGVLTSVGNAIKTSNTAITGAMLGGVSETNNAPGDHPDGLLLSDRERIIQWMRGMDLFDDDDDGDNLDTRNMMGDPLHVRPAPVIYGGTASNPDMVIYTSTNDGYFHAIDPETGEELWSFVPSRLLGLMQAHYEDAVSSTRIYGLDGEITAAILNDDKKGGITGDERVVLIFGMRRGGDAYFAIDVTDRNNPELLWELDSSTPGFAALGQTWSTPQHARVRAAGGVKEVVFVGGGYDPVQDNGNYRTDNQGNAVYMIDIETGQLLWSAGKTGAGHDLELDKMDHGIPAPLRVVDLNGDGLASRLYFGDMGGRVWRIDIINGNDLDEIAKGGVIASLGGAAVDDAGGTPVTADLRRFYSQADVVDVSQPGYQRFIAVNIGSGYRAHPLDTAIDERFFSIRDVAVNYVPENDSYDNPVLLSEMVDITGSNGIDTSSNTRGWYLRLVASSGEKILSRSITFAGTIFVTSFAPGSGGGVCSAVAGRNRLYALSLFNGDSNLEADAQYIELAQGGIAPQVELLYVPEDTDGDGKEEGQLMALIGTEDVQLSFVDPLSRTYWTQDGAQ